MSADGNSRELLTDLGSGPDNLRIQRSKSLFSFREKQMEGIVHEYRDYSGETPAVKAVCRKNLWSPASLAADAITLPYYVIVLPIDFLFIHPPAR